MISAKDVDREIRTVLWPFLEPYGFIARTGRATWRYGEAGVDVIEVLSVGANADAVGCTSFSLTARAASLPTYIYPEHDRRLDRAGRFRPHYWDSALQVGLTKSLAQPWFEPFSRPPKPGTVRAVLAHREALSHVLRRDRHDRPDIWYVLDDGTNLHETITDVRAQCIEQAVPLLDRLQDPCQALAMIEQDRFVKPDSPTGLQLRNKSKGACTGNYGPL